MTTRVKVWSIVPAVAVIIAVYYPFSPGGRQQANMRLAERHIGVIRSRTITDKRFAELEMSAGTAEGGCLVVIGIVPKDSDIDELKAIVSTSNSPVPVRYAVRSQQMLDGLTAK